MVTSISKAMKTSPGFMPLTVCYLLVILSRSEFERCLFRGVLDTTLCDKFVSDLRQVGGFLWVLMFPPPIKLTIMI